MTVLSTLTPFQAGESLVSNFSRLAAALDYSDALEFAGDTQLKFTDLLLGYRDALDAYAEMLECSPAALARGAIPYNNRLSTYTIAGENLHKSLVEFKHQRFCIHCVADDERRLDGRRGHRAFGRLTWLANRITTCPVHETPLIALPSAAKLSLDMDFAARLRSVDLDSGHFFSAKASSRSALEVYALERLEGAKRNTTWPNSLSLDVVIRLSEQLGRVDRHGPALKATELTEAEASACADHGLAILTEGPAAFEATIRKIARRRRDRTYISGLTIFGSVYRLLKSQLTNPDYAQVNELCRSVALEELPLGRGDEFLGAIKKRTLHSIFTGAKAHKVDPHRLIKLLIQTNKLSPSVTHLPMQQVILAADDVNAAAKILNGVATIAEARTLLSADRAHLEALARTEILMPRTQTGQDDGVLRWYARTDIEDVLERVNVVAGANSDWAGLVDVDIAARKIRRSLDDVLTVYFEGSLKRVAMTSPGGIAGIRVDVEELSRILRSVNRGSLTLRQAARELGVSDYTLDALIAEGHLSTEQRRRAGEKKIQTVVARDEIERFDSQFISAWAYAKAIGLPMRGLEKLVGGAAPAFDKKRVRVLFYRRSDLTF